MKNLAHHYITKIEGHGVLNVSFREHEVKLEITEGERLFEALVIGKHYSQISFIVSRICGVCPVAHSLSATKAIEKAFEITPSNEAVLLRRVLEAAQIIQSHALHLYFLILPDYYHLRSGAELIKKHPKQFAAAMELKRISDLIVKTIGGRAIHPQAVTVGGMVKTPEKSEIRDLKSEIRKIIAPAMTTASLFLSLKYPESKKKTEYLSLKSDHDYEVYDGLIHAHVGQSFNPADYEKHIKETVVNYSHAKHATHDHLPFMVGALARLSNHQEYLNPKAKKLLQQSGLDFPTFNSFHNNLAQAIEVLHLAEELNHLMLTLEDVNLERAVASKIVPCEGEGAGVVEAPRGLLFHYYKLDEQGRVVECDIITPTVQNLTNLESDAEELVNNTEGMEIEKRKELLEMLIRAYDPCITCSVH